MARDTIDIKDFKGLKVTISYGDIVKDNADKCNKDIIENAKARGWDTYADGWVVGSKQNAKGETYEALVHNYKHYQLTHLLENGHIIANKKGGVGWASPHPHIKPAFDKAKADFIEQIKQKTELKVEME